MIKIPRKSDWVTYEKDEVEALISKLAKEGHSSAMVGQILRDQYGVPNVRKFGIKTSAIVRAAAPREIPEDLFNLLKQAVKVHRHLSEKRKDAKARHALDRIESKIRRLAKFYVSRKRLPKDWTYSFEKAKMLVG